MILLGPFQLRLFCDSDFLALPVQGMDPKKHKPLAYRVSGLCALHCSQDWIYILFLSPTTKPPQPELHSPAVVTLGFSALHGLGKAGLCRQGETLQAWKASLEVREDNIYISDI